MERDSRWRPTRGMLASGGSGSPPSWPFDPHYVVKRLEELRKCRVQSCAEGRDPVHGGGGLAPLELPDVRWPPRAYTRWRDGSTPAERLGMLGVSVRRIRSASFLARTRNAFRSPRGDTASTHRRTPGRGWLPVRRGHSRPSVGAAGDLSGVAVDPRRRHCGSTPTGP